MWQFWIDVGGTFTDCLGRAPDGSIHQFKTLSSGRTRGRGQTSGRGLIDAARKGDPADFWAGSICTLRDAAGTIVGQSTVMEFDCERGELRFAAPPASDENEVTYELDCGLPAPVVGIRWLLRLSPGQSVPPVELRLGTTRGTNALLTRTGAETLLVTTRGFADVPLIGNQTRPDLFALNIHKSKPLFSYVLEVDERIAADGQVLQPLDTAALRRELNRRFPDRRPSVVVCLMHAWINDTHEFQIEAILNELGFREVSRSSEVAPLIRFVPRCDTTCLDAYLNPVLNHYLATIRRELVGSSIRVMTSTGGLTEDSRFRGRDSLLSGPAGGIVGFASVAQQEGYDRAIGFDMGGTSTDVARFDGEFEYQSESIKAGVRVMTPVLAIETVAAGGGSLCGFDGVRLFVGPQSAGADPGPACYGAGGPLTVTDLNVFLGRIPVHAFPLPLDLEAVRRKLDELVAELSAAGADHHLTDSVSLASGLLRIADDNMVQAIRRVSVAQGYNPADYVLVTFGGAGGQHACSVARALGIRTILLHPLAGVLSAWGIGHAATRAMRERTQISILNPAAFASAVELAEELAQDALADVVSQGVTPHAVESPRRFFLMRYAGTDAALPVAGDTVESIQTDFQDQHRRLYGFVRPEQPIEISGVRVEAVGWNHGAADVGFEGSVADELTSVATPRPDAHSTIGDASRRAFRVEGQQHAAAVFPRSAIRTGDVIPGPAVISEPTSTTVIDAGCVAHVLPSGTIRISVDDDPRAESAAAAGFDAIALELISNRFTSIADQMGLTLRRTAMSTNVRERLDYSCAIFDRDGRLVVNAPHVPVHLGAMQDTVQAIIADQPDMHPGDVFVTNDPYRGGSHLPDLTVVTPVFLNAGDTDPKAAETVMIPACFVASRAHHAEIGGIVPGSMPPHATRLSEEGVLIPARKLVDRGTYLEEDLRTLLTSGEFPSRAPSENLADLTAQVAANSCGARLLQELCRHEGADVVAEGMQQIQNVSAFKMRQALRGLPDGDHAFRDALDDGSPVVVTITVRADGATIDFTGTGPVHPGNLNANRSITTAAVLYTFRCLLQEDVPLNAGFLEPLTLVIPEGMLNPRPGRTAASSPAIAGGNVETSQRVVDVLFGALGLAAASQGTMNNLTIGDPSFGYYETICGGSGATNDADGADAVHTHMTNTRLTDPEILEQRYPVRLRRFAIRRGSGGAGAHHGGDGVIREIEFLQPVTVSLLSQRRTTQPYGLNGGCPGKSGLGTLIHRDGQPEALPGSFTIAVSPGERLVLETPGGGGYGK